MMSDSKDHLGQNDHKDSHYNLIQCNGLADLDLMPISVADPLYHSKQIAGEVKLLLEYIQK